MSEFKIIFENNIEEFVPNNSFDINVLLKIPKINKFLEFNKLEKTINLNNISRSAFMNIIAFIKIQNSNQDNKTHIIENCISNMDIDTLFDFIIATEYLELSDLKDIAGHLFKNVIRNCSSDKIRDTFKLNNDLHILSFNL
jgi:hypothetical protein